MLAVNGLINAAFADFCLNWYLRLLPLKNYRLILYKQIEGRWHYVRLTALGSQMTSETGLCGALPDQATSTPIPPVESNLESFIREKAESWTKDGYAKPHQQQLHVMTLHFQMRRWTGYPAGAPWYDDWTTGYLDPIQEILEKTCNGIPRGNERFSGNYLHYFVVFNIVFFNFWTGQIVYCIT